MTRAGDDDAGVARIEERRMIPAGDEWGNRPLAGDEAMRRSGAHDRRNAPS
jgi:hypothetical protein